MKFDYAIGNPPYQALVEWNGYYPPIYHLFMDEMFKIAKSVEVITPARYLTDTGSTPHEWNQKMLNDPHFQLQKFYPESGEIFPNTGIIGGVAITYRNEDKIFKPIKKFIRSNELSNLAKKITAHPLFESAQSYLYWQNKSNIDEIHNDYPEFDYSDKRLRNNAFKIIPAFITSLENIGDSKNYIKILGLFNGNRQCRYINKKYIDLDHENLAKYKVVIPGVNGCRPLALGYDTPVLGRCVLCGPNVGYTQTFFSFGVFNTEEEGLNALKYINTKFTRAAIGILKSGNGNGFAMWEYAPMQNFTNNSDINWTKSIEEIDKQLYTKYKLSNDDINYIEQGISTKNDFEYIK